MVQVWQNEKQKSTDQYLLTTALSLKSLTLTRCSQPTVSYRTPLPSLLQRRCLNNPSSFKKQEIGIITIQVTLIQSLFDVPFFLGCLLFGVLVLRKLTIDTDSSCHQHHGLIQHHAGLPSCPLNSRGSWTFFMLTPGHLFCVHHCNSATPRIS